MFLRRIETYIALLFILAACNSSPAPVTSDKTKLDLQELRQTFDPSAAPELDEDKILIEVVDSYQSNKRVLGDDAECPINPVLGNPHIHTVMFAIIDPRYASSKMFNQLIVMCWKTDKHPDWRENQFLITFVQLEDWLNRNNQYLNKNCFQGLTELWVCPFHEDDTEKGLRARGIK